MLRAALDELKTAIIATPGSDSLRLEYADCIDQEEPARAELIRVQCELFRLAGSVADLPLLRNAECLGKSTRTVEPFESERYSDLRVREWHLLRKHRRRWTQPYRGGLASPAISASGISEVFQRGFVQAALISPKRFLSEPTLLLLEPVRELRVSWARTQALPTSIVTALVNLQSMRNIQRLDFSGSFIDARSLSALVESRNLPALTDLGLERANLDNTDLKALLAWPRFGALCDLDIVRSGLPVRDLVVAANGHASLRRLSIGGSRNGSAKPYDGCDAQALRLLAFPSLTDLSIQDCSLGTAHMDALAQNPSLAALTRLNLTTVVEGNVANVAVPLLAQGAWRDLERLEMSPRGNRSARVGTLARLGKLRALHINWCSDRHVRELCEQPWPCLRALSIGATREGTATLGASPLREQLQDLAIHNSSDSGDAIMAALLTYRWPELRRLTLWIDLRHGPAPELVAERMPRLLFLTVNGGGPVVHQELRRLRIPCMS